MSASGDFPKDSGDPGLTEVERSAADWVVRRQRGLTAEERQSFDRWLERNPENRRIFGQTEETSLMLDGLRSQVPKAGGAGASRPGRRPVLVAASLALAASVVLLLALGRVRLHSPSYARSAATEVGESRSLALPDGSVALLNTNTALEVLYTAAERRVTLVRGEAYFTVAKNPARPFWVAAGPVAVRAVGTAFNVRLRLDAVNVLVTEGKVRVVQEKDPRGPQGAASAESGSLVVMGQLARISLAPGRDPSSVPPTVTSIGPRAVSSALAWREGRLDFIDAPLSEVVAEFNRYNLRKIVIDDPSLASRRFGGAFASHRTEPLIELLEQSFGVVSENRGDATVIRLGRK